MAGAAAALQPPLSPSPRARYPRLIPLLTGRPLIARSIGRDARCNRQTPQYWIPDSPCSLLLGRQRQSGPGPALKLTGPGSALPLKKRAHTASNTAVALKLQKLSKTWPQGGKIRRANFHKEQRVALWLAPKYQYAGGVNSSIRPNQRFEYPRTAIFVRKCGNRVINGLHFGEKPIGPV